jgi:hypothetical protein
LHGEISMKRDSAAGKDFPNGNILREEYPAGNIIKGGIRYLENYRSTGFTEEASADSLTLAVVTDIILNPRFGIEITPDHSLSAIAATDFLGIYYNPGEMLSLFDVSVCMSLVSILSGKTPFWKKTGADMRDKVFNYSRSDEKTRCFLDSLCLGAARIAHIAAPPATEGVGIPPEVFTKRKRIDLYRTLCEKHLGITGEEELMDFVMTFEETLFAGSRTEIWQRTVKWSGSILLHEVMHILNGDVTDVEIRRRNYIASTGDVRFPENSPERYSPAVRMLGFILNIATDAVINDTIRKELLRGEDNPLPVWAVNYADARLKDPSDLYAEALSLSCGKMAKITKQGKYIPPETIISMEMDFIRMYDATEKKLGGMNPSANKRRENGKDSVGGKGTCGRNGKKASGTQSSGNENNGENDWNTGSPAGEAFEAVMDELKKMFAPGAPEENPLRTIDDHEFMEKLREQRTEELGEDPWKHAEGILKKIISSRTDEAELKRLAGQGSLPARIMLHLLLKDMPPPPAFSSEIKRLLRSASGVRKKPTYRKFSRDIYGILPQMSPYGKSPVIPGSMIPRNKGSLVMAIDVSGSVKDREITDAFLKALSMLRFMGPGHRVTIVQMDDGIVDWREFITGGRELHDYIREMEKDGFTRKGCGGTGYAEFFKCVRAMEKGKKIIHGNGIPECFPGMDYGVPVSGPMPDAVIVFTDWGFNERNIDYPETVPLYWVGVVAKDRAGSLPSRGKIIEPDSVRENNP